MSRVTSVSGGLGLAVDGGWVTASMLELTKALPTLMPMCPARIRKRRGGRIQSAENTSPTLPTTALKGASTSRMERPSVVQRPQPL